MNSSRLIRVRATEIHAANSVREQVRQFHSTVSVFSERAGASKDLCVLLDKSKTNILCDRFRELLAMVLLEHRFGIEQVQLTGASCGVDENTALRGAGKVGEFRCEWV